MSLTPRQRNHDFIPILLNWKPSQITEIDVLNTDTNGMEKLELTTVNRAVTVPLVDRRGREDFHRFFRLIGDIPQQEVDRAIDEAVKRLDTSHFLNCTLNRYIWHGTKLLNFCRQPDSIIITTRDDESIYRFRESELNRYWRAHRRPYRLVRTRMIVSEL